MTGRHARQLVVPVVVLGLALLSAPIDAQVGIADIRARAERGDADAQLLLGVLYAEGRGVPQDEAEAVRWFRRAAEQGNTGAGNADTQFSLGVLYAEGRGVPQDEAEAARWYCLAAESDEAGAVVGSLGQGNADAQFNLGVLYAEGRDVPQDYVEAVRWFRRAAEQGYARAQNNLGNRYANGQGVPQDYVQAHVWYNLAASRRSGEDRQRSIRGREGAESRMTPDQIAEAQRLAREWDAAHPQR